MEKMKISFYNNNVYYEKLSNGLEIYVIPNNTVNDFYVTFTTKYGGCNYKFKVDDKYIQMPNGIAHFLEHKMFDQEDGIDPFVFYNNSGTYCNAFTNYFNTSYVFAGTNNFEDNLNYLLDFVQSPYFTEKNVNKEKGIIKQEIKMYDDMPDNILFEKTLDILFNVHPIKYSIAGTINDIDNITKDDLYTCYNMFYHPKNMFIVITGNVNASNAIEIIRKNQDSKRFKDVNINIKSVIEPNIVACSKKIIKHNVAIPLVSYSIKIPLNDFKIDRKKLNIYLSNMFNILFDETSIFYEKIKNKKLIDTPIDIDNIDVDNYKVFILSFKTRKYERVINEINKVLNNIIILSEDLERKKKVEISNLLYMLDDIERTNKLFLNNKVIYDNIYTDIYKILNSLNIDEMNAIINKLNLRNKSILIIESNK
ncbi:MAG: insulinase family protein [Bacilli bacterium]|nr:insulinase family protein [Bacilli bacterium]